MRIYYNSDKKDEGENRMAKYTTKDQLIRANIPEEIRGDCLAMMEAVEQLGSPSYLAIIHTQDELDTITKQVQNVSPEVDEFIPCTSWRKRVYVLDDYGHGIVVYDIPVRTT